MSERQNHPSSAAAVREQRLDSYLRGVDRQLPMERAPYFVGRKAELASFKEALTATLEGGGMGQTFICQGAPGAGKSALLEECAAMASQRQEATRVPHIVARAEPGQFGSVDGLCSAIHGAIRQQAPDAFERLKNFLRRLASRGITIAGSGIGPASARDIDPATKLKAMEEAWKDVVIVLLTDEAQNIEAQNQAQRARGHPESAQSRTGRQIAQFIHAGQRESRMLLACFGLSDTMDTLGSLGVSRGSLKRRHDLRPLSIEEAAQSVAAAFEDFAVTGNSGKRERWFEALAQSSQGWPQHLRILTEAALRELKANGMALSKSSLDRVLSTGEQGKRAYYSQRLENVREHVPVYRKLAKEMETSGAQRLDAAQITRIAAPHLREWNTDFREFLSVTVHAGILSPIGDQGYAIPIPSFAQYLRQGTAPQ